MTYLPDVNVWLALASRRHTHTSIANQWLEKVTQENIAFCRITQMGLLRMLTNIKVMGVDVINRAEAWNVYSRMRQDPRLSFFEEPANLEVTWRSMTQSPSSSPGDWTDDYILAFAHVCDLTVVTFDQAFQTVTDSRVIILS